MTLEEFTLLVEDRPVKVTCLERLYNSLWEIPKYVSKTLLVTILPNIFIFGIFIGFFALGHYLKYANPYHSFNDPPPGTFFVSAFVYFIPVAAAALNILSWSYTYDTLRRDEERRSELRLYTAGFVVVVILWFIILLGVVTEGYDFNWFQFQEVYG